MLVEAVRGEVFIRLGTRFSPEEAARVSEAISTFSPVSKVTLDFASTSDFHDTAIFPLAASLNGLRGAEVVLHGLTRHQSRLVRYFGLEAA